MNLEIEAEERGVRRRVIRGGVFGSFWNLCHRGFICPVARLLGS